MAQPHSAHGTMDTCIHLSVVIAQMASRLAFQLAQQGMPLLAGRAVLSAVAAIGQACQSVCLECRITYPQFVEVLLCVMTARASSLLEPDVKQLRPIGLDGEMQVGRGQGTWSSARFAQQGL